MKMNKTLQGLLSAATMGLLLLAAGCAKDNNNTTTSASACIEALQASVPTDSVLQFKTCTTGAVATVWNFGDGSTATTASPTHSYIAEGTYTVTLNTTNSSGTTTTATATVTVAVKRYLVKMATVTGGGTTLHRNYTYDGQGRLLTQIDEQDTISYVYGSGNAVTYTRNRMVENTTLNAMGMLTAAGGYTYTYDANGYQTGATFTTTTISYTVVNGNTTYGSATSGSTSQSITYTFRTEKDTRSMGAPLRGRPNKNLPATLAYNSNGSVTNYSYSYSFDAMGRVSTEVLSSGGSTQQTTSYTYY